MCKCGLTLQQSSAVLYWALVRAEKTSLNICSYYLSLAKAKQRFRADGILFPHLHKALSLYTTIFSNFFNLNFDRPGRLNGSPLRYFLFFNRQHLGDLKWWITMNFFNRSDLTQRSPLRYFYFLINRIWAIWNDE